MIFELIFVYLQLMRFIANILTSTKVDDSDFYNVVKDENCLIDGIPTLIIGWERAKKLYPKLSILEWKINDNTYWTFGKRERRDRMEEDIIRFKNVSVNQFLKRIKYSFINVLTMKNDKKSLLFESIKDSTKKYVYCENDMLYIYNSGKDSVVGMSLRDIEYEGGNVKKLFSMLHNTQSVEFVTDNGSISYSMKKSIKNKMYLIPYLLSD